LQGKGNSQEEGLHGKVRGAGSDGSNQEMPWTLGTFERVYAEEVGQKSGGEIRRLVNQYHESNPSHGLMAGDEIGRFWEERGGRR